MRLIVVALRCHCYSMSSSNYVCRMCNSSLTLAPQMPCIALIYRYKSERHLEQKEAMDINKIVTSHNTPLSEQRLFSCGVLTFPYGGPCDVVIVPPTWFSVPKRTQAFSLYYTEQAAFPVLENCGFNTRPNSSQGKNPGDNPGE